jgi:putative ABC transport system permease protein
VFIESLVFDIRYALRGIRRSPLFACSVAGTIGLGLGVLCSGVTILNGYFLRPIDLPDARSLYELSWDTKSVARHRFQLSDVEALRDDAPFFNGLAASADAVIMQDGVPKRGRLVTGNYFQVLRGSMQLGRTLTPADASTPGESAVVVISNGLWRVRYGADPHIIGKEIVLRQGRFEVVGVAPAGFGFGEDIGTAFWAPLTMARAFGVADPWSASGEYLLSVIVRFRDRSAEPQVRAWFDTWARQRFPESSDAAPVAVRVEPRGDRVPLTGLVLTLLLLIVSAFALVLLVACANVTNLMLARGFGRQREIAVRLSLGARRLRIVRQLVIEGLVLGVPAALGGLALTYATARAFPALIAGSIPTGVVPVREIMMPIDPDSRVIFVLCSAAVVAAVFVSFLPALRVTRANLVRASKGEAALDTRGSRLRTGLVALQIGACVLFIVAATGLIDESKRLANPPTGLSYELVSNVNVPPKMRDAVAARLAADPAVERVAASWRPPMSGPLRLVDVVASQSRIERAAGFMVVSPEYFPVFGIRIVRGRAFTKQEADDAAPVALVSEATARMLWPGLDPLGQTLQLAPSRRPERGPAGGPAVQRQPDYASVRIIGVAEDVTNGPPTDAVDTSCVYFATGFGASGDLSLLVRARRDTVAVRAAVAAAVTAIDPNAAYQAPSMREILGFQVWAFQAFSVTASLLGVIGLVLAFSGTYAVVAFLLAQRTREFGIRMAIGATVGQIVAGMMGETMRTASIGLGVGLMVAFALARAFGGVIPIIPSFALRTYLVGAFVVLAATTTAALLPSRRVGRINPSSALRAE